MTIVNKIKQLPLVVALATSIAAQPQAFADEFELSGKVGFEQRYFEQQGQYSNQLSGSQASIFVEPEFYWGWNDGYSSVTFKPYYRQDEFDNERSHGDIRELSYVHAGTDWELRAGIRREFWGVTEFQHLVDVINQTDGVEDSDGEDKLGQLMLNLSLVRDWGILDIYLLPGFRERTFVGKKSRLRGAAVVDPDDVSYQSSAKDKHLDFAIRWSQTIGDFDIGSYWFHGTNRDPLLMLSADIGVEETPLLKQYYNQMDQFGLDVQATLGDWLWKFETIYRTTDDDDFLAAQAGLEYTYVGVFDSNADLGLLLEYGWDSRGEGDENSPGASIQNDIFFGSRLAFNDMQSSEMLVGLGADVEHSAFSFIVEANRRFGESVKVSIDVRLMQSSAPNDVLYSLKDDDHLQLAVEYYF